MVRLTAFRAHKPDLLPSFDSTSAANGAVVKNYSRVPISFARKKLQPMHVAEDFEACQCFLWSPKSSLGRELSKTLAE